MHRLLKWLRGPLDRWVKAEARRGIVDMAARVTVYRLRRERFDGIEATDHCTITDLASEVFARTSLDSFTLVEFAGHGLVIVLVDKEVVAVRKAFERRKPVGVLVDIRESDSAEFNAILPGID